MKGFLGLALLAIASLPAVASYDLMLLPGNAPGAGTLRYDPISETSFGDAGPKVEPRHVTGHLGKGYAIATSGARAYQFNYSTGERITSFNVGAHKTIDVTGNGNHLLVGDTALVKSLDLVGGSLVTYQLDKITRVHSIVSYSDQDFYVIGTDGFNSVLIQRYQVGKVTNVDATATSFSLVSGFLMGQADYLVNERTLAFTYRTTLGTAMRLGRIVLSPTGLFAGFGSLPVSEGSSTFDASTVPTVLNGHDGFFLAGWDGATSGAKLRISEFDGFPDVNGFGAIHSTTLSRTTGPEFSAANLIAPEPGTWLALGVGLTVLMRSRRPVKGR